MTSSRRSLTADIGRWSFTIRPGLPRLCRRAAGAVGLINRDKGPAAPLGLFQDAATSLKGSSARTTTRSGSTATPVGCQVAEDLGRFGQPGAVRAGRVLGVGA